MAAFGPDAELTALARRGEQVEHVGKANRLQGSSQ
jgi:hypothetical protein